MAIATLAVQLVFPQVAFNNARISLHIAYACINLLLLTSKQN